MNATTSLLVLCIDLCDVSVAPDAPPSGFAVHSQLFGSVAQVTHVVPRKCRISLVQPAQHATTRGPVQSRSCQACP